MTRLGIFFLLVLLSQTTLFSLETSAINTPVSITVSATPVVNLSSFNINPLTATSGSALTFTVNVSNSGNTEANVTLNVTVYDPLNAAAGNFTFNQITIFAGENQTVFRAEVLSYPANDYRAVITGVYGVKITNAMEANFTMTSSAPSAPPSETFRELALFLEYAVPPTLPPMPPAPPGVITGGALQISNQILLKTAVQGERFPLTITMENPLNESAVIAVNFSGVPREWVEYSENASLEAGEKRNVILWITVPENASTANYFIAVNISYNNASITSPIALKVGEIPAVPFVTRDVYADYGENKTDVALTLKNPTYRTVNYIQIQERIEKAVAPNISYLKFITPPTKILEEDPLVQWDFENVVAGEQREVRYEIAGIVKEFSAPVKVPVEQINIISIEEPERLRIARRYPSREFSGEIFTINVTFTNLRAIFEKVFVTLEFPEGWSVTPQNVTVAMPSRTQAFTTFWVRSPYNMPSGTYYGIMRAQYGDLTIEDILQFNVERKPVVPLGITLEVILAVLVFVMVVVAIISMALERREKKKK